MSVVKTLFIAAFALCAARTAAQPALAAGQVDIFAGAELHYRSISYQRMYDVLVNLTPGIRWSPWNQWQVAAQALVPVYNDYGKRYRRIRLNLATLSREVFFKDQLLLKVSGGWFTNERYGVDLKGMYVIKPWLVAEWQAGLTGFCSMAAGWEASMPQRWTALGGMNVILHPWHTQFRIRAGRFIYADYGVFAEGFRHFRHCSVGAYAQYSDQGGTNGGFKIVMMIPPYHLKRRKVNIRPASNFRLTYNIEADAFANKMYHTDPEENEREGWFSRKLW